MPPRPHIDKIYQLAQELATIVPRVRVSSTEPRPMHRGHNQISDTPMVTLMAMEPARAHNRSYIVSAREHAEQVIVNREQGVSPELARQAWGLMRDLYEALPQARICNNPDSSLGRSVGSDGTITEADGDVLPPNALLSSTMSTISQAAPHASRLMVRGIREGRARNFVVLIDAAGGVMLATDVNALAFAVRSILVPSDDADARYQKRRLHQWMQAMGIEYEQDALQAIAAIHSIARFDIADTWHLNTSN